MEIFKGGKRSSLRILFSIIMVILTIALYTLPVAAACTGCDGSPTQPACCTASTSSSSNNGGSSSNSGTSTGGVGDLTMSQKTFLNMFKGQIGEIIQTEINNGGSFTGMEIELTGESEDGSYDSNKEAKIVVTLTNLDTFKTKEIELKTPDYLEDAKNKLDEISTKISENRDKKLIIINDLFFDPKTEVLPGNGELSSEQETRIEVSKDIAIDAMEHYIDGILADPSSASIKDNLFANGDISLSQFDQLLQLKHEKDQLEKEKAELEEKYNDLLKRYSEFADKASPEQAAASTQEGTTDPILTPYKVTDAMNYLNEMGQLSENKQLIEAFGVSLSGEQSDGDTPDSGE